MLRLAYYIAKNLPCLEEILFTRIPTMPPRNEWKSVVMLPVRAPELKVFEGVIEIPRNSKVRTIKRRGEGWTPEHLNRGSVGEETSKQG